MIVLRLSLAEAAALSAACIWADGKHRHPNVQSARLKLRAALDKPHEHEDEAQRFIYAPS